MNFVYVVSVFRHDYYFYQKQNTNAFSTLDQAEKYAWSLVNEIKNTVRDYCVDVSSASWPPNNFSDSQNKLVKRYLVETYRGTDSYSTKAIVDIEKIRLYRTHPDSKFKPSDIACDRDKEYNAMNGYSLKTETEDSSDRVLCSAMRYKPSDI